MQQFFSSKGEQRNGDEHGQSNHNSTGIALPRRGLLQVADVVRRFTSIPFHIPKSARSIPAHAPEQSFGSHVVALMNPETKKFTCVLWVLTTLSVVLGTLLLFIGH
jgi:hypothetical protein